jgi:hypothetical protein
MLSIGLEQQHHCRVGLLPLLAALLQNAFYAAWPGKFLHRMEPQRGRLALQKLLVRATEMFGVSGDRFVSQCD